MTSSTTATSYVCPTCNAKPGEPCRTPKGRLAKSTHDTRSFDVNLPPEAIRCFYEEIGEGFGEKIYETSCNSEVTLTQLTEFCGVCRKRIAVAPGCRRCGSTEHTTGWHDSSAAPLREMARELPTADADLIRSLIGDKPNGEER